MYDTAEIRWILPGRVPAAIARWFRQDSEGLDDTPEVRTDRYVVLPGCETVGIKLRDAQGDGPPRLDVKARLGDATELRLAPGVAGQAAAWTKWTLTLADHGSIVSGLESPTPVLSIRKRRLVRRYVVEDDRTRNVPIDEDVIAGCDIELCSIIHERLDEPWWSLGLEAFGPAERVQETLSSVGRGWFKDRGDPPLEPPHRFDGQASSTYPAWLAGRLTGIHHGER